MPQYFPYPALDKPTISTLGFYNENSKINLPVAVIGDGHGVHLELVHLLQNIFENYDMTYLVSVGDLTDRGPESIKVCQTWHKIKRIFKCGEVLIGNHDRKLIRYLLGYNVPLGAEQQWFTSINSSEREMILDLFLDSPSIFKLIDNTTNSMRVYVAAHAAVDYSDPAVVSIFGGTSTLNKKSANIAWYGHTTGKQTIEGYPERLHILCPYKDMTAIFGHIVHDKEKCVGYNEPGTTIYIDHGAVFGGYLSAVIIKPGHTWEILSVKGKEYFRSRHKDQQRFETIG